jgi:hypothetical protein
MHKRLGLESAGMRKKYDSNRILGTYSPSRSSVNSRLAMSILIIRLALLSQSLALALRQAVSSSCILTGYFVKASPVRLICESRRFSNGCIVHVL